MCSIGIFYDVLGTFYDVSIYPNRYTDIPVTHIKVRMREGGGVNLTVSQ